MAIEIQTKNPVIRLGVPGPQSNVQPDWSQNDSTQPDYIKNKIGYREIFTKQTGVCTIENIEANTLYLVQDLSIEDEDTLANIRNNMRYSKAGNRLPTIVPKLNFWTYMPYFGTEAALSVNFNKNHFTQYDTSDEYNYYLSEERNRFYIILDRTKLSSENAAIFPKDGIYFKTTNANTNRVSTAIYDYHRIDTLYLSSSVATIGELNEKQDTLIQSGATVGQIAKITAVDSSGKPTAWEAVDMPSGGGGASYRSWSKVWTLAVAEDIAGFAASDIDLDGKSEIMIVFISDSTASRTMVNGRLLINGVDAGKVLFNSLPLKKDSHSFVIIGRADDGIEYTTMQATAEYQTYPWQGEVKIVHRMVSGTGSIIQWTDGSTIEITQSSATLGQGVTIEIYVR